MTSPCCLTALASLHMLITCLTGRHRKAFPGYKALRKGWYGLGMLTRKHTMWRLSLKSKGGFRSDYNKRRKGLMVSMVKASAVTMGMVRASRRTHLQGFK